MTGSIHPNESRLRAELKAALVGRPPVPGAPTELSRRVPVVLPVDTLEHAWEGYLWCLDETFSSKYGFCLPIGLALLVGLIIMEIFR
jgi:hypothetical protein